MISETTVFNHLILQWLPLTIYKIKPHDSIITDNDYLFINRISATVSTRALTTDYIDRSRFSFTIVCRKTLWPTDSAVDILNWYVNDLRWIYGPSCSNTAFNSFFETVSPILYTDKDRPFIVVDFIFYE